MNDNYLSKRSNSSINYNKQAKNTKETLNEKFNHFGATKKMPSFQMAEKKNPKIFVDNTNSLIFNSNVNNTKQSFN